MCLSQVGRVRLVEGSEAILDVEPTLLDEARTVVCRWVLRGAQPRKWSGPALSAKGKDVAIEELVLVAEQIDFESS